MGLILAKGVDIWLSDIPQDTVLKHCLLETDFLESGNIAEELRNNGIGNSQTSEELAGFIFGSEMNTLFDLLNSAMDECGFSDTGTFLTGIDLSGDRINMGDMNKDDTREFLDLLEKCSNLTDSCGGPLLQGGGSGNGDDDLYQRLKRLEESHEELKEKYEELKESHEKQAEIIQEQEDAILELQADMSEHGSEHQMGDMVDDITDPAGAVVKKATKALIETGLEVRRQSERERHEEKPSPKDAGVPAGVPDEETPSPEESETPESSPSPEPSSTPEAYCPEQGDRYFGSDPSHPLANSRYAFSDLDLMDCECLLGGSDAGGIMSFICQDEDQKRLDCMLNPWGPDDGPRPECIDYLATDSRPKDYDNVCGTIYCGDGNPTVIFTPFGPMCTCGSGGGGEGEATPSQECLATDCPPDMILLPGCFCGYPDRPMFNKRATRGH